ncbi:polysaccharide deacetylase family protein [Paenibacillus sp. FJAT-26967]|uniref:polysaccharide deacetylase family protein n=1 Tax=Paenibacillus sp. FJAT-26967 TaxID=1729690 RepID=UPI000838A690|nr:polysaccharide deacetylase family protein [Paenibacillus sp. FJAT-26967]
MTLTNILRTAGIALTLSLTLTACGPGTDSKTASTDPSANQTETGTRSPDPASSPAPQAPSASPSPNGQQTSPAPSPEAAQKSKYRINSNYDVVPVDAGGEKKVVLLTFDDGPKEKAMLESMLGTLDKHKAKAIFFMNGTRIKQHPELAKLIHDRGQALGNHSWDHVDLKKENPDNLDHQIGDVVKILEETTGSKPRFFRPPYGSGNDAVKAKAKAHQLIYMTWSNGSMDWEMSAEKNDPDKIVASVLEQLHPGSNILMHELPWTADALDKLLTELEKKGYTFVDPAQITAES